LINYEKTSTTLAFEINIERVICSRFSVKYEYDLKKCNIIFVFSFLASILIGALVQIKEIWGG
jgi:hypothetical protein